MKIQIEGYITPDIAGMILSAELKKLGVTSGKQMIIYFDPNNNKLPPVIKVNADKFMEEIGNPNRYAKK